MAGLLLVKFKSIYFTMHGLSVIGTQMAGLSVFSQGHYLAHGQYEG